MNRAAAKGFHRPCPKLYWLTKDSATGKSAGAPLVAQQHVEGNSAYLRHRARGRWGLGPSRERGISAT